MDGNGAEAALEGFCRQMKRLPARLRKSMPHDRGLEMACHLELAPPSQSWRLKIAIWFCDRHAPWQRGANENSNGLWRQFLPKGTDPGQYSQRDLSHIAKLMNDRPHKTLGWKTPAEAITEDLASFAKGVAVRP